jgi:hypothetical protein
LLAILSLCSKFAEDAPDSLNCEMLHRSHGVSASGNFRFSIRSLRDAEIQVFDGLGFQLDFEESFFEFVQLFILCLDWNHVNPDSVFELADKLSTMIYIRLVPSLVFNARAEIVAAAVISVALRVILSSTLDIAAVDQQLLSLLCKHDGSPGWTDGHEPAEGLPHLGAQAAPASSHSDFHQVRASYHASIRAILEVVAHASDSLPHQAAVLTAADPVS